MPSALDPAFPLWTLLVALVALVATSCWYWRRTALRGWMKLAVLLCRWGAAGMVLWILAGPYIVIGRSGAAATVVLLVDGSVSMDFPAGDTTRAALASHVARTVASSMDAELGLQTMWFGAQLHPELSPPGPDSPLRQGSRLAHSLRELLTSGDTPPSAVVVLSDGAIQDAAALPSVTRAYSHQAIPISTYCAGGHHTPRNVALVSCDAAAAARSGTRVPITIGIRRDGCHDEAVAIQLVDASGKSVDTATLAATLDPLGPAQVTVHAVTGVEGFTGSVRVTPVLGETTEEDNAIPLRIASLDPKLRILYMEGTNRVDHGIAEPLFFADALDGEGQMEVDILVLNVTNDQGGSVLVGWPWKEHREFKPDPTKGYPRTREELYRYDVVICSDIPRVAFTDQQIDWTVDFVADRGGGFVMIGGKSSFGSGLWDQTPWDKLIPLDMAGANRGLTFENFLPHWPTAARHHPLLAHLPLQDGETLEQILDAHPLFLGTNFVRRAKPAATVIMNQGEPDGMPIMAVQAFGKGRTMGFASDVTFFWGTFHNRGWGPPDLAVPLDPNTAAGDARTTPAEFYNNAYFRRFWIHAMHWLAEGSLRLKGPEFFASTPAISWLPDSPLTVHAGCGDDALLAKLAQGTCTAEVTGIPESRTPLRFNPRTQRFEGSILARSALPAECEVIATATSPGNDQSHQSRFTIRTASADIERADPAVYPDRLALVADETGGVSLESADDALTWIRSLPATHTATGQWAKKPHWDRWPLLAAVLTLLGAEWLLRRLFT